MAEGSDFGFEHLSLAMMYGLGLGTEVDVKEVLRHLEMHSKKFGMHFELEYHGCVVYRIDTAPVGGRK